MTSTNSSIRSGILPLLFLLASCPQAALCQATEAGEDIWKSYFLDCSGEQKRTNMKLELSEIAANSQDAHSLVFLRPGSSALRGQWIVPVKPTEAILEIEHLSSSAAVPLGGISPVTVTLNDHTVVRDLDPGSHSFTTDRLTVTKYLRAGANSMSLVSGAGRTRYWLRRCTVRCRFPAGTVLGETPRAARRIGSGDYAVVVSHQTYEDEGWRSVVDALVAKHSAATIIHPGFVSEAAKELGAVFPKYACFVARPEELGQTFVLDVHHLTRQLDEDPYGDVLWGIVTGYCSEDALRIAQHSAPLQVRRGAGGCSIDLKAFVEGVWYSEGEQNVMWEKRAGEEAQKKECPDDTTKSLVDELNANHPDLFATSGHATPRDWQIGYTYKNGQFRCEKGQLFGLDTEGKRFDINSPNPKVYSPLGNCLMGLVDGDEAMALAWMRTGGAYQMAGYTIATWYGYAWGIRDYFIRGQGEYDYAEAFFFNNQALLHQLQTRFPKLLEVNLTDYGIQRDKELLNKISRTHQIKERDALGLLWDRDTMAFYGDPAWDARLVEGRAPAWEFSLVEDEGRFVFEVTAPEDTSWGRPPAALLPYRVKDVKVLSGAEPEPVITDNFILLPVTGERKAGDVFRVEFSASAL